MKNKNMNIIHRENIDQHNAPPHPASGHPLPRWGRGEVYARRGAVLLALVLAGGCTLGQSYPETQIRGYINGQPFAVHAPKDSNLIGFDAVAETNGAIHVHIDSLQCSLNPTNLMTAATGQAAIISAVAQAVNQAIQTGGTMALKAAVP